MPLCYARLSSGRLFPHCVLGKWWWQFMHEENLGQRRNNRKGLGLPVSQGQFTQAEEMI